MTISPDEELTPQERLTAELVDLQQRFPGGYQVALGIWLGQSIEAVEALFTAHQLPMREQLVAELTTWRCHAQEGVKFLDHINHLMSAVMERINPSPRQRWRREHR